MIDPNVTLLYFVKDIFLNVVVSLFGKNFWLAFGSRKKLIPFLAMSAMFIRAQVSSVISIAVAQVYELLFIH